MPVAPENINKKVLGYHPISSRCLHSTSVDGIDARQSYIPMEVSETVQIYFLLYSVGMVVEGFLNILAMKVIIGTELCKTTSASFLSVYNIHYRDPSSSSSGSQAQPFVLPPVILKLKYVTKSH